MSQMNLGDKVRSQVSGFEGILVSKTQYLTGNARVGIKARVEKNKEPETEYFDPDELVVIEAGAVDIG